MARLFEPECQRLGIAWRLQIEDGVRRRCAWTGGQMEQALVNIVRNAIDARRRVTATSRYRSRWSKACRHCSIEDSGGGIPPEVAPRLFTSFFSTKPNGQGIGLTLVQEILIAHGFDYQPRDGSARAARASGSDSRTRTAPDAAGAVASRVRRTSGVCGPPGAYALRAFACRPYGRIRADVHCRSPSHLRSPR